VTNLANGNSYAYDANGNMTSRNVGGQSFTLVYDTENRLVSVTGAATASFYYDADGKQVIGTVNGVTTYYVGQHYEKKSGVVTKYYFAGAMRLAVRTGGTLSYLLGDHLGSSSVTTDANGGYSAQELYKAFGETRYSYGTLGTDYHFTGQREEASLGIYYFNARWMDPSLGRFTQPDTIVPTQTQGTQAWDRYAFVNNNPVRYTDPTGHRCVAEDGEDEGCLNDDGSKGAGFTGYASSSSGSSSNASKGCGGQWQRTCRGGEPPVSNLALMSTLLDSYAFGLNAIYAIVGDLVGFVCPGCYGFVESVYQYYMILPNSVSTIAMGLWIADGIESGETSFSVTQTSLDATITLSVSQDSLISVASNIAGWTVLRDPNLASMVDAGVAGYDFARLGAIPGINFTLPSFINPTISYNTSTGWDFSW
jgi:RHS repeat-associated protein